MTGVKLAFKPSFGSFSTCGECHTSRCSVSGIEMVGELLYNEGGEPLFMRVLRDPSALPDIKMRVLKNIDFTFYSGYNKISW